MDMLYIGIITTNYLLVLFIRPFPGTASPTMVHAVVIPRKNDPSINPFVHQPVRIVLNCELTAMLSFTKKLGIEIIFKKIWTAHDCVN